MSRRYMTVMITPSPLYSCSSTIFNHPQPDNTSDPDPTTMIEDLGMLSTLPPSACVNILDEHTETPPLDIEIDGTLDYTPKLSKLVTLKLPRNREALKNLDQTHAQGGLQDIPSDVVEVPSCFRKASTSTNVVLTSKSSYIAWLLEDNPPICQQLQRPLPSQFTPFELSGIYTIGECMKGCAGPPPGTGCPTCEPVDFKNIAQVHGIIIK